MTDIRTMIPAPDEAIRDLEELVAKAEASDGPEKLQVLSFIGARMGPVLARLAAAEEKLAQLTAPASQEYLVWSREYRSWWGPGTCRYFGDVASAGRFTLAEAAECASRRSWRSDDNPPDVVIPAPSAALMATPHLLVAYLTEQIKAATVAAVQDRRAIRTGATA